MGKRTLFIELLLLTATALAAEPVEPMVGDWPVGHVTCRPVPLGAVQLGGFLGYHVERNDESLLAGLDSPIPRGIEVAAAGGEPPKECRRLAADSDFYKWLEGACYTIAYQRNLPELSESVEDYVPMMLKLQEESGFMGTRQYPNHPFDTRVDHDLYVAGHFIEAAVAHYKLTGRTELIEAAKRYADFYIDAWKQEHPYFQEAGRDEHPEIEPALVRLYRVTDEPRFLEFADAVAGMSTIGPRVADLHVGAGRWHAVRVCYLLTGLAELYIQTGEKKYREHLDGLWKEIVETRMYITGGIGHHELIAESPYDLPPALLHWHRDIAETCASVSLMMFTWRMHAITGDSRCFDVIERILYNHYLGAISPDHLCNFYYNPLRCVGDMIGKTDHGSNPVQRRCLPEIHSTACCLPNAWRFFGQLPEYVFSHTGRKIMVNLYTDGEARIELADGTHCRIEIKTDYPFVGEVHIRLPVEEPTELTLALRIPGWCEAATVQINHDQPQEAKPGSYWEMTRTWRRDDRVLLEMPMYPRVIMSRPEVIANVGQVALMRGPLVYCLENTDAGDLDLGRTALLLDATEPAASVTEHWGDIPGMAMLDVMAGEFPIPDNEKTYRNLSTLRLEKVQKVQLIPFFYRANRSEEPRWITWMPVQTIIQ